MRLSPHEASKSKSEVVVLVGFVVFHMVVYLFCSCCYCCCCGGVGGGRGCCFSLSLFVSLLCLFTWHHADHVARVIAVQCSGMDKNAREYVVHSGEQHKLTIVP